MKGAGYILSLLILALQLRGTEVDYWFERHQTGAWQQLEERWDEVQAAMTTPVENIALPLDYHPNGRIKARLKAREAQLFLDGMIFAKDVEVEMLNAEGEREGRLLAQGCLFDRGKGCGYCRGAVVVEREFEKLKGRDMYFSIEDQFIKIMAQCEIRTRRVKHSFGRIW